MAIEIDSQLVLVGLLTKELKPISGEKLWDIRSKLYQQNERFLVDVSCSSVRFDVLSRPDLFTFNSKKDIIASPENTEQFKNTELFELYISNYDSEVQEQIKSAFGLGVDK